MKPFYKYDRVKIADLKPYKKNARQHSPAQIDQIVAAISEYGFTNPVLIDEKNNLIAGHGRLEAARILEMSHVPAITVTGLTERKRKALVIADNKLALNSIWDFELLGAEIMALTDAKSFDVEILGFSEKELANLIGADESDDQKDNTNYTGDRSLLMIEFSKESDCESLYDELIERGFECKILT